MTLLARLRALEADRPALICQDGVLRFGALVATAEALAPRMAGRRLFLNLTDPAEAIALLAAADGRAASVVLASPALDPVTLADLFTLSGAELVITDRTDLETLPRLRDASGLEPAGESGGGGALKTGWIMTTSGTTGRPKLVAHGLDSLTRTTRGDPARGAGQVWGLLYDYTRFAGLQVVLQSLLSGATLVAPPADLPLAQRLALLASARATHLSATPTLWRKILMTEGHADLALQQVTLGGEIADDAVLSALTRAYPGARVSHIFASTEAGVGFSVTDRRAGFPAAFLSAPPAGIGLKIDDGRLHVRNDLVGADYLGGQGALAQDGWVDTGDLVVQQGDRVLFRGRGSGVINVGGDKVHPEEVERAVLSHPGVRLVRVYAKSNPITGALVAADIVPSPDAGDPAALRADLKAYLAQRLERHMVPAFIRIVADFDINAAGKLQRN